MAEKNPPVWMQSGTYNAVDDRLVTGLLSDRDRGANGLGSGILGGVVPGFGQLAVTANGSNMQVTVAAGTAVIPSVGVSPPGAYIVYNEGTKNLTLDIESSSNPRIDVVYADVDDQAIGDAASEWRIAVKKGNPSASPTTPTLSTGQIALASVTVKPASQNGGVNKVTSAQIIDRRPMLTGLGGVHVTKNNMVNPPHAPGRLLYNQDSKKLHVSNGSAWDLIYTYQEWMSFFAAYRPRHAGGGGKTLIETGAANNKTWTATPKNDGSAGKAAAVQVKSKSPSGMFKITLSSFGRTNTAADGHAHVSCAVKDGNTVVQSPGTSWNSIGFYSKNWEHHGTTYVVWGLTPNKEYTFELQFYRSGPDANTVSFYRSYLMIDPVI